MARVAACLAGFETALKERLRAASVLHHDETPARVAGDDRGRLLYIYTARAGKLVWFGAAAGRGHAQLDAFGILPGYRGTLVRDDYAAYAKYDQHLTAVQLCCAHLIRSLRGIGDMDDEGTRVQRCWTEPVISALTDARAAVAKARASGDAALDGKLPDVLRARYDDAVAWGIATNAHRDWPGGRAFRLHPGPPPADPGRPGAALHGRLRRAVHQQPRRTAPAHGQAPDEDRRLLAQRPHRRPLLPHPFLPGHRPPPRHPPPRRPARRHGRRSLDAPANLLINHRPEWIHRILV